MAGVELLPLCRDQDEDLRLERWAPVAGVSLSVPGGAELLVLASAFDEGATASSRNPGYGCGRWHVRSQGRSAGLQDVGPDGPPPAHSGILSLDSWNAPLLRAE